MDLKQSEVTSVLKAEIAGFSEQAKKANVGTVLVQFAVVFTALLLANRWLARRVTPTPKTGDEEPER